LSSGIAVVAVVLLLEVAMEGIVSISDIGKKTWDPIFPFYLYPYMFGPEAVGPPLMTCATVR